MMKLCGDCGHPESEHTGVFWRNEVGELYRAPGMETSCMIAENLGYSQDFCSCLAFTDKPPASEYYVHGYGGYGVKVVNAQ